MLTDKPMRYIIRRLEKGRGTKVVAEMKASQRHVQRHVQRLWYRKTGDGARSRPGLCRSGCRPVGAICRGPGGSAADCTVAAGRAPPPGVGSPATAGGEAAGALGGAPRACGAAASLRSTTRPGRPRFWRVSPNAPGDPPPAAVRAFRLHGGMMCSADVPWRLRRGMCVG